MAIPYENHLRLPDMTRATNARAAGVAFLVYIAAGITSIVLFRRATSGAEIAAKLATLPAHATEVSMLVLLGFVQVFCAIVLGVTLYAITRDEDSDLAMLGLVCRSAEGIIGAVSIPTTLALLQLARGAAGDMPNAAGTHALAAYFLRDDVALPATFFAVGSLAFCYLLLRARSIPVPLAWLGVVASVLLAVGLPLRLAGWLRESFMSILWLPMLLFEVPVAVWLIAKGVAEPRLVRRTA
jgi:hypothetical protein